MLPALLLPFAGSGWRGWPTLLLLQLLSLLLQASTDGAKLVLCLLQLGFFDHLRAVPTPLVHHLINLHAHFLLLLHDREQFSQKWHAVGVICRGEVHVRNVFLAL